MSDQGNKTPEMGKLSPVFALDWDQTKVTVTADGESTFTWPSLAQFIIDHPQSIVYLEATFESYDPEERLRCLRLAMEYGVDLRTFRPLSTAHRRKEQGLDKSDTIDALMIWRTAHETKRDWKRPTDNEMSLEDRLAWLDLNRRQVMMRNSGYLNGDARRVANYIALDYPHGMGRPIALASALAAEFVLLRGGNRSDFDRAVGAYGAGYPSKPRSDFYYHAIRGKVRAGADRKETMRELRRQTRQVFHTVRQGISTPVKGTSTPGVSEEVAG